MGWTALQAGMLMIPSTIFTAVMMPLVGKLMERGTPMRLLISIGMVIFFIYSIMAYYVLTPNTGSDAFFWILVIRGVGLGLLSIPVTTLALSTLKGQEIGQGAALSGMLRQLGGSFGVAIISTYLIRQNQKHRVDLLSHFSATNPVVQQRLKMMTGGFHARGMPIDIAGKTADKLLNGMVNVQATILSYMDVFLWIGVMFLVCVPFVILFVKKPKRKVDLSHVAE
jgi:DHA2 family multidrug resistance protein